MCAKHHFTLLKIYHAKTKKDRNIWLIANKGGSLVVFI